MTHPAARDLFLPLVRSQPFQQLARQLAAQQARSVRLSGLTPTVKALYAALLWEALGQPLLVITGSQAAAEAWIEALDTFHAMLHAGVPAPAPLLVPAWDVLPGQGLSPHSEIKEQRAAALCRLASGRASIVVTPVESALQRLRRPEAYLQMAVTLRKGDEIAMEDLAAHLVSIGYQKREPVEMEGEFSIRGGIFDVFPAEAARPVRIEFFGDTVESLRRFDPETQRSVLAISEATIYPIEEVPLNRTKLEELAARAGLTVPPGGEPFSGWEFLALAEENPTSSLEDFLDSPVVIYDEPETLRTASDRLWKKLESLAEQSPAKPEQLYFHWGELSARRPERREIELRELLLESGPAPDAASVEVRSQPGTAYRNNLRAAIDEARDLAAQGWQVAFFAPTAGDLERLADVFSEYSLPFQLWADEKAGAAGRPFMAVEGAAVHLVQGRLPRGARLPEERLALVGSRDLFEAVYDAQPARARPHAALFTPETLELKPGDYVVHAQHGIGRFTALRQITTGGVTEDFMVVEYAGGDRLYVPLTRLDLIQKYRGSGEAAPSLDRLGGVTWAKTKARVKAKMRDMAEELLKLYAARKIAEGFAFSPDSAWQREFEDAFEFTPTRDQLQAAAEIKRDMESPHPMDRLLCGDVGFGKTEVAMRAAFKALGDGKQVAVLAPTTVLALQHFETFKKRFAPFPVRVEMLSRFRTPREIKAVLADLAEGKVDILIGTHRILSKDVVFADLGLLIIDEEQRFGVRHKERLKQLRQSVDVLTMSATPIPRTLHMALLGLRDMSVIETPPKDRLAVQTVVAKFHPELIRTAIEQELDRGGQVYFIHNRVDSIWSRAAMLQELVPRARIAVGHGQMGEEELERVLLSFMRRESDVFVCTTIVENGLDIPLANTMIIENAQNYGLSELYQLRGRVGRSNRRAYAYLLVPDDGELTEVARKRLAALKEFSDLGSGFKIAALDLELRGAGNLLGGEQHGHIASVGYETYVKLLEETARELRGEPVAPELHSSLNLGLDVRIPQEYISDEQQRLRAYKRIADSGDPEKAQALLEELADRYGPAPEAVRLLVEFSQLKSLAERCGVESIDRRGGAVLIKFHPGAQIDPERLMHLVSTTPQAQFTPAGVLRVPAPGGGAAGLLGFLRGLLEELRG
ncbi:MAG: transcription-repair coupling factor [Bryobacteraceae bacterium]|nr:transcription-repair coupling factor [Bryobacteraceae bacterium]